MDGFMILGIVLLAAGFLFVGIETLIPGFGAPGNFRRVLSGRRCVFNRRQRAGSGYYRSSRFIAACSFDIYAGYTACKGQVKDTDYSE